LAVNNFTGYHNTTYNAVALASFLLLFASGSCAIIALSHLMRRHWLIADQRGWRDGLATLLSAKAQGVKTINLGGREEPIDDTVSFFQTNIGPAEVKAISLRWWIVWLQRIRLLAFLAGMLLLLETTTSGLVSPSM